MAGDEDKKTKKKKVKKVEKPVEEAPPPEPEPTPAPAAEGDDWLSAATEPDASTQEEAPAPAEGEAGEAPPVAEDAPVEGVDGEIAEPPPAPKKKPKYYVHWDRKKPKFYDYNFDYGESYYSPVVGYLDNKNLGSRMDIPRRMGFAERGINFSLVRKNQPDLKTSNILNDVRSSIRGFESFQRTYAHDMQRKYM